MFKRMKACGITIQRKHMQVPCITAGGFRWFAYGSHNLLCFLVLKEELNVNICPQLSLLLFSYSLFTTNC